MQARQTLILVFDSLALVPALFLLVAPVKAAIKESLELSLIDLSVWLVLNISHTVLIDVKAQLSHCDFSILEHFFDLFLCRVEVLRVIHDTLHILKHIIVASSH